MSRGFLSDAKPLMINALSELVVQAAVRSSRPWGDIRAPESAVKAPAVTISCSMVFRVDCVSYSTALRSFDVMTLPTRDTISATRKVIDNITIGATTSSSTNVKPAESWFSLVVV